MEPLNHPIALRMEGGCSIGQDSKEPDQTEEVNWAALSEVRTTGTPNLETQVERKARTQDSAEMKVNGATSGQQVLQSIMVRR